jgi:hypothetical protein
MRICITTDRLPQPERQRGCILEIDAERGLSLIGQGFAVAVDDPAAAAPPDAPAAAPAAAAAPRRIRASAK